MEPNVSADVITRALSSSYRCRKPTGASARPRSSRAITEAPNRGYNNGLSGPDGLPVERTPA